jgi:hypothetical protein
MVAVSEISFLCEHIPTTLQIVQLIEWKLSLDFFRRKFRFQFFPSSVYSVSYCDVSRHWIHRSDCLILYFTIWHLQAYNLTPRTIRVGLRPQSLRTLITNCLRSESESKSHCDWRSVSLSVLVSSPIWGSWPDIYCLTVRSFLWGALYDERTGLSFVYAVDLCQRSLTRVRVSYFTGLRSESESESLYDWQSVSLSVLVSSPVWGSWPDI